MISDTSKQAHEISKQTAGQVREQIFDYIESCATGATCDEVERSRPTAQHGVCSNPGAAPGRASSVRGESDPADIGRVPGPRVLHPGPGDRDRHGDDACGRPVQHVACRHSGIHPQSTRGDLTMAALIVWVAVALVAWWSRGERQRLEAEDAVRQVMDS